MINCDMKNEAVQSGEKQTCPSGSKDALMREVQAACFAAYDLQLYLNTHPTDSRAMMMYTAAVQRKKALTEEYEKAYGPITADSAAGTMPWQWIKSPWTWE